MDNNPQNIVCDYFLKGHCMFGDNCKYLHPKSQKYQAEPIKKVVNGVEKIEGDEQCSICLDFILQKGKRFGLLENCDHPFCLECIRNWRATYDKKIQKAHYRTCPQCRTNSYLVIPSNKMISDGPEKDELIEEYTDALYAIPCRHFNNGKGYCPFQNSCFYSHIDMNGEEYEYPFMQTYIDEDGVSHVVEEGQEATLADMLNI